MFSEKGYEVEKKFRVSAESLDELMRRVTMLGALVGEEFHVDRYYSKSGGFLEAAFPYEWLSVRTRNSKFSLNYKHFFPEGAEEHDYCEELEVELGDATVAHEILVAIGFGLEVVVKKKRMRFSLEAVWVMIDEVDGLGCFVEVEAKERTDVGVASESIKRVIEDLRLEAADKDRRGYPFRLLNRE